MRMNAGREKGSWKQTMDKRDSGERKDPGQEKRDHINGRGMHEKGGGRWVYPGKRREPKIEIIENRKVSAGFSHCVKIYFIPLEAPGKGLLHQTPIDQVPAEGVQRHVAAPVQ